MAADRERFEQSPFIGRAMTERELMALPKDGFKYELVDGRVSGVPLYMDHAAHIMRVFWLLAGVDRAHGRAIGSNLGCRMRNGNIRTPDGGFLLRAREPVGRAADDFLDGAPDLAVEVLSAAENPLDVTRKIREYQESGARQAWLISPDERRVTVYGVSPDPRVLGESDTLDGGDLLPGIRCRVEGLFEPA
jgi:Uma2 family endonuclease